MSRGAGEAVGLAIIRLLAEVRQARGWSMDEVADRAGVHRTYIGLLERGERQPTLAMAVDLAAALGVSLSDLLQKTEAQGEEGSHTAGPLVSAPLDVEVLPKPAPRGPSAEWFRSDKQLSRVTGLDREVIAGAIAFAYETLDLIDEELVSRGSEPIASLVELANLSAMLGNLLGAGLARASRGRYSRNGPHKYPDLLALEDGFPDLELKTALESNSPRGHLPKAGPHLTFRYVLCDRQGEYTPGREGRGVVPTVWEVRFGTLTARDYSISNTEGDSGKTAVIRRDSFQQMELVYEDDRLVPYLRRRSSSIRD